MSEFLAKKLQETLAEKRMMFVTAESCTGGLIGVAITDTPGASKIYDRGFITYSNDAKKEVLGVDPAILEDHGAVSAETAAAMAEGALKKSPNAHFSVSVTGIAGPDGGTPNKPVGLVYIAVAQLNGETVVHRHEFEGDRDNVRKETVNAAFAHLIEAAEERK